MVSVSLGQGTLFDLGIEFPGSHLLEGIPADTCDLSPLREEQPHTHPNIESTKQWARTKHPFVCPMMPVLPSTHC